MELPDWIKWDKGLGQYICKIHKLYIQDMR